MTPSVTGTTRDPSYRQETRSCLVKTEPLGTVSWHYSTLFLKNFPETLKDSQPQGLLSPHFKVPVPRTSVYRVRTTDVTDGHRDRTWYGPSDLYSVCGVVVPVVERRVTCAKGEGPRPERQVGSYSGPGDLSKPLSRLRPRTLGG